MREILKSQLEIGELDIVNIEPNPKSRDEIDKIAVALIHIYSTPELQKLVFSELHKIIPPNISKEERTSWYETLGYFRTCCLS